MRGALGLHPGNSLQARRPGQVTLPSLGHQTPVGREVLVAPGRGQWHVPGIRAWTSGVDKAR